MLLRRHVRLRDAEVADQVPIVIDLESMTVDELKAYAAEKGIDLGKSSSHEGILKKIQDAEAIVEPPVVEPQAEEPPVGEDPATPTGDPEE